MRQAPPRDLAPVSSPGRTGEQSSSASSLVMARDRSAPHGAFLSAGGELWMRIEGFRQDVTVNVGC